MIPFPRLGDANPNLGHEIAKETGEGNGSDASADRLVELLEVDVWKRVGANVSRPRLAN